MLVGASPLTYKAIVAVADFGYEHYTLKPCYVLMNALQEDFDADSSHLHWDATDLDDPEGLVLVNAYAALTNVIVIEYLFAIEIAVVIQSDQIATTEELATMIDSLKDAIAAGKDVPLD